VLGQLTSVTLDRASGQRVGCGAQLRRQRAAREPTSGHTIIAVFDVVSSLRCPLHQRVWRPRHRGRYRPEEVFMAITNWVSDPSLERGSW